MQETLTDTVTFSISQSQTFPTMGSNGMLTGSFSSSLIITRQDNIGFIREVRARMVQKMERARERQISGIRDEWSSRLWLPDCFNPREECA